MRLILDSDALIALERNDRAMWQRLKSAHRSDVIDAAVVLLAEDHDHVITSDPEDLRSLAEASGRHVELIIT